MNFKTILACICGMMVLYTGFSQSVYQFKYNFHSPQDSINYNALLVSYENGSGLLRVRYEEPAISEDVVVETDVEEMVFTDEKGLEDTAKMVLKTSNPRIISGQQNITPILPIFIFSYNSGTGFIEPSGIADPFAARIITNPQTTFTSRLIENTALTKRFVLQYFNEGDDFYKELFKPVNRGLSPVEKNTKIILLAVANTLVPDIGPSGTKNLDRIVNTFGKLAGDLGLHMDTIIIAGKVYNRKNVLKAIDQLRPAPNDIVVFYYSGHGFRKSEDSTRKFPYMDLRSDSMQNHLLHALNIEDVFETIRKKRSGSGFNLVLSDCCNSDVLDVNPIGSKPLKKKSSGVKWDENNFRELFLNKTSMSVLATAADNGQKAACNLSFGGFFSYYFLQNMENNCSKLQRNASWHVVMADTKKQTLFKARHTYCRKPHIPENICFQIPAYRIVY